MALTYSGGASGGILTPQPIAVADHSNFTDLITLGDKQLISDYDDNLVKRFGNQSIQGFLAKTSAEFPLVADRVEWHEEGRLHLYYENATYTSSSSTITRGGSDLFAVRVGQVVLIGDDDQEILARVKTVASNDQSFTVDFYSADTNLDASGITVRVIGSEFDKGTTGMGGSVETDTKGYSNRPAILKDQFSVSGSGTAQIGWIKVEGGAQSAAFNGNGGWLWYLKSEMDNRARFMDYLESFSLEIRTGASGSDIASIDGAGNTEGIFQSLEDRGINASGGFADDTFANFSDDIDATLKELDKQGNVQENLMYLNRDESLAVDNGLALANSYGTGGQSYGAFNNMEDMALNLGFKSFTRGSYTFHKTDWKYLNDLTGRSSFTNGVKGVMTPAGTMNVYDQGIGDTVKRPFIHIRYRASQTDNRKLKTWVTGSVGASNSDLDAMELHYLSERCPIIQGANNFVLFK